MAELTRVPAPGSPLDGWAGRILGVLAIAIAVAVVKPWGDGAGPGVITPDPPDATDAARTAAVLIVASPVPIYDPLAFGPVPPPAAWALLTGERTTPLGFIQAADPTSPATSPSPDIVSGPVVDLGPAAGLHAIVIAHPAGQTLAAIRLWRFGDGGPPRRIDLRHLRSPWPQASVSVVAPMADGTDRASIGAWWPGLYRMDLLIEPGDRIRTLMLTVGSSGPSTLERPGDDAATSDLGFDLPTLRRLPPTATLWSAGRILSGWRRDPGPPTCRIAEIWQATDPLAPCWPVPIGRTEAVGVNLPDGHVVTGIALRPIDPLPDVPVPGSRIAVGGRPGLALVRAPTGGLSDGIYRLDVEVRGRGTMTWYLEVGPIGRAVDPFNEASTTR
ncbi:MAG: hypothetical protein WEC14_04970 [Chloroflexota bacterium]